MNALQTHISLTLLFSITVPVIGADRDPSEQKIGWPGYRPKQPIVCIPQPPKPICDEHPATFCLLVAEINRTSVNDILERVRQKGRSEGIEELRGDRGDMPFVVTIPSLLLLQNTFDSTMKDHVAQKILKLANVEQLFKYTDDPSGGMLDQYTHFSAQKENGICTIQCTTNIDNISTIERIIAAIKQGDNQ